MSIDARGRAHAPAGTKAAGQYAPEPRADAGVDLVGEPFDWAVLASDGSVVDRFRTRLEATAALADMPDDDEFCVQFVPDPGPLGTNLELAP